MTEGILTHPCPQNPAALNSPFSTNPSLWVCPTPKANPIHVLCCPVMSVSFLTLHQDKRTSLTILNIHDGLSQVVRCMTQMKTVPLSYHTQYSVCTRKYFKKQLSFHL